MKANEGIYAENDLQHREQKKRARNNFTANLAQQTEIILDFLVLDYFPLSDWTRRNQCVGSSYA